MELNDLLNALDRTAANLAKLQAVWDRAQQFIPTSPVLGSNDEYDDLSRAWSDLRKSLPPIDGWTITEDLPDIDALGHAFLDAQEIGVPPFQLLEVGEKPGKDIAAYRYRMTALGAGLLGNGCSS